MRESFKKLFAAIRKDEKGVTLVEYGVAIALAVFLGTAAMTALKNDISSAMSSAGAQMP